jgi:hypothetical protein
VSAGVGRIAAWGAKLNPILVQCARTRLRGKHFFAWGSAIGLLTTAVFLGVFLTARLRAGASVAWAARATFIPLLVVQWFVLVFLGTGSVANGIAADKDTGTLDYHRLTPMSAASKALGYLFGLPIREYALFGLTVPFVLIAAIVGGMSFLGLAELYVVFFAGVVCYHLAGLVSGMLAKRARRANWIAQAIVVVCYFLLPQLARLGFHFFGFLTIMPTLRSLVVDQVGFGGGLVQELGKALGVHGPEAPFFGLSLPPSIYALLVQGLLSATLLIILLRKWRDPTTPALSKRGALLFYAAVTVLVVGSVWHVWERGAGALSRLLGIGTEGTAQLYFLLALGAAVFLLWLTTPRAPEMLRGWRRVRKRGLRRIPRLWDEASTLWVSVAFAAIAAAGYALLLLGTRSGAELLGRVSPLASLALPVAFLACVIEFQAARQSMSGRGFLVWFGLIWIVPVLVAAVVTAAAGPLRELLGAASLSPWMAIEQVANGSLMRKARDAEVSFALIVHGAMAAALLFKARRARLALERTASG